MPELDFDRYLEQWFAQKRGDFKDVDNLTNFAQGELDSQGAQTAPAEQGIISTSRGEGLTERIADVTARANRASDVTEGIFERQTRGQDLSDRQRKSATRRLSLTRRLSEANAATEEGRATADRATMAGRASLALDDQIFGQQLAGLQNLANSEGQRQIREAEERAQKKANRNAMLGSLAGATIASFASSEKIKDKEGPAENVLDKLRNIRVEKWRYKGDNESHMGAYAEEFNDTFGVNQANRDKISIIDAVGVLMGSLQELDKKVSANA